MILISDVIVLLVAHFIGDFVCQSRMMADNKSKNIWWLLTHGIIYSIILFILMFIFTSYGTIPLILFSLFNGLIHIIFDKLSSTCTSKYYKQKQFYRMFTVIGFDQLLHLVTLLLTTYWFLSN